MHFPVLMVVSYHFGKKYHNWIHRHTSKLGMDYMNFAFIRSNSFFIHLIDEPIRKGI